MSALASLPLSSSRVRLLLAGAVLSVLFALSAAAPQAAHAAGCSNNWESATGGSWSTAADWSKKAVPVEGEEVCITKSGTYAVTYEGISTLTLKSLTIGGTSGTQTLEENASCGVNPTLATTGGLTTDAEGALVLGSTSCGSTTTVSGPITNGGTLTAAAGDAQGARHITGNLTNTGTIQINWTTDFEGSKTTLTNEGALRIAEARAFLVKGESTFNNSTGGSVAATGNGELVVEPHDSFIEGKGTTSGSQPVVVREGSLTYNGAGSSTIAVRDSSTLSGSLSSGQTLNLQSLCGENELLKASANFSNAGAINLDSVSCGGSTELETASGSTFTNTGSVTTQVSNEQGSRLLVGNAVNKGTITIAWPTTYEGAKANTEGTLTNEGTLKLESKLTVPAGNTVVSAGGEIAASGANVLQEEPGATFTQGAGKTSGTEPVLLKGVTLNYTGSGASTIAVREASTLTGNISAGQTLNLEGECGENTTLKASASYSSAGAINLISETCGSDVALETATGSTFTNTGTVTVPVGDSQGTHLLVGSTTNKGTITIAYPAFYEGDKESTGGTLTNEGTLKLEAKLQVHGGNSVDSAAGEIIGVGAGVLQEEPGSTFTQGAGKTSGAETVILKADALDYTGSGAGILTVRQAGTLSGNISAGQTLTLQSECGENTELKASASYSSAGTINLTSATCGSTAALETATGSTFTNTGTVTVAAGNAQGARYLVGSIDNKGTITFAYPAIYEGDNAATEGTLTNEGTVKLEGVRLSVHPGNDVDNVSGEIAGTSSGLLFQEGGQFTDGAGKTSGTDPVQIQSTNLVYNGKGPSTVLFLGDGSVSSEIPKGQTLILASRCGINTAAIAASIKNLGTVKMISETCGGITEFKLGTGTFTNAGKFYVERSNAQGSRTVEGDLVNEKSLYLVNWTLNVTGTGAGTFTQTKKGTFEPYVNGSSEYGAVSAGGAASITGKLTLKQNKKFVPTSGETFEVLHSSALTGEFTKVSGNKIAKTALSYVPHYSATAVTLKVE